MSCYVSVSVRLFSSRVPWYREEAGERTHELMNKLNRRLTDRETKRRLADKLTDGLDWKQGHRGVTALTGRWSVTSLSWRVKLNTIRRKRWRKRNNCSGWTQQVTMAAKSTVKGWLTGGVWSETFTSVLTFAYVRVTGAAAWSECGEEGQHVGLEWQNVGM